MKYNFASVYIDSEEISKKFSVFFSEFVPKHNLLHISTIILHFWGGEREVEILTTKNEKKKKSRNFFYLLNVLKFLNIFQEKEKSLQLNFLNVGIDRTHR